MTAKILVEDWQGRHNVTQRALEIQREGLYRDCSTVCVMPTRGVIAAQVVQNWMGMLSPMNQKFTRMFVIGLEVGKAYDTAIQQILDSPEVCNWKYVLTLEEDNLVPPDGLLKLLEDMHNYPQYDVIGGLYWTKGEGGQPMCYGDPLQVPKNYYPQVPPMDAIQEFNALGMGFTLFRMEVFKKLKAPWFKSVLEVAPDGGVLGRTQDMYFFINAGEQGLRFACDSRVKVGHFDVESNIVW